MIDVTPAPIQRGADTCPECKEPVVTKKPLDDEQERAGNWTTLLQWLLSKGISI